MINKFKKSVKNVAVYFCTEIDQRMYPADVKAVLGFCEEEKMNIVLLVQEETPDGAMAAKGYATLHEVFLKGLIDGVVTLTKSMLDSAEGEMILNEAIKENDRFVLSYMEEITRREEDAEKLVKMAARARTDENRISIFSL